MFAENLNYKQLSGQNFSQKINTPFMNSIIVVHF